MSIARIGKFTIQGELGAGAHSTIFLISRHEDGRQYALKVVPIDGPDEKKFQDQAEHEFRVAQMLDHENLIKIYALEKETNWRFQVRRVNLLIEYVNGQTLDKLKAISVRKLLPIFVQVASGLVHMHRRGLFHADMKPNNIILNRRTGQAKIIDYGLAWIKGETKGRIQGTPEYMAPETISSNFINERTDIFNFGATMYRLATFRKLPSTVPEADMDIDPVLWSRQVKPVCEINAGAPKELGELIHRCLEFDAHKRPETMREVKFALDKLGEEQSIEQSGPLEW